MKDALAEAMVTLDSDGNGKVSLDEFHVWWRNGLSLEALRDPTAASKRVSSLQGRRSTRNGRACAIPSAAHRAAALWTRRRPQRARQRKNSILYGWDDDVEGPTKDRPVKQIGAKAAAAFKKNPSHSGLFTEGRVSAVGDVESASGSESRRSARRGTNNEEAGRATLRRRRR